MNKEKVLLTGASGSMGWESFQRLWERRSDYDIVLLLRPSKKNKRRFRRYEQEAGIAPFRGAGVAEGGGLKIVWGDVLNREDVEEACRGIDWCLHTLALISPEADRKPEMTYRVNYLGTKTIVEVLEAQDPENVRMVYISSIATYGDRLPPLHWGRTGDPVIPSKFDNYALTKIRAELAVMHSRIRYKVVLRQTFIMIPDLLSLMDPIMYHQALNSFMENITARDSGRLLVSCLDVPPDSPFWNEYHNVSGGPACRTTCMELLESFFGMLGMDARKVMDRNWFALKNFHMVFFEDADRLNRYLHHWEGGWSQEDYYREVWKAMPWYLKLVAWLNRSLRPFRWLVQAATHATMKRMALKPRGTLRWIRDHDRERVDAFFGSRETWEAIPDWKEEMPSLDHGQPHVRLDHGYDESKAQLEWEDLQQAAAFRGGILLGDEADSNEAGSSEGSGTGAGPGTAAGKGGWDGDMYRMLHWECAQGHRFDMSPHAVLKGGHWCTECISEPWDYGAFAGTNRFAAQVLDPPVE
jgi:nucleoside-diphosphate-sugar epimerase